MPMRQKYSNKILTHDMISSDREFTAKVLKDLLKPQKFILLVNRMSATQKISGNIWHQCWTTQKRLTSHRLGLTKLEWTFWSSDYAIFLEFLKNSENIIQCQIVPGYHETPTHTRRWLYPDCIWMHYLPCNGHSSLLTRCPISQYFFS